MKYLFTGLLLLSNLIQLLAQESLSHKGERYFVYPHRKKSNMSWAFINGVDLKNPKNKDILFLELYNTKEIEPGQMEEARANFESDLKNAYLTKISKKQRIYIRQNSDKYYMTYYAQNQGLIPSLDPLPDGKFVQLFDHYYLMDKNGNLLEEKAKIAGFFSIKNNLPEGFAYWLNEAGDTIEQGNFVAGQRVGKWQFKSMERFDISEAKITSPNECNSIICQYAEGMLNGSFQEYSGKQLVLKGNYKDDEASGEWFEYRQIPDTTEGYYLYKHYTYADKKTAAVFKKPIIRKLLYNLEEMYADTFDLPRFDYNFPYYMNELYEYNFVEQEDYELPEEKYGSYDGGEISSGTEEEYYGEEEYDESLENQPIIHEGKRYDANKLIDSIGVKFTYTDVYETFWPNGKVQFRYNFNEGQLQAEDTAFWDNGKPANVITYDAEKMHYFATNYDLKGRVINNSEYDSIGRFISKVEGPREKFETIEGLKALVIELNYMGNMKYYNYDASDTLDTLLTAPVSIFRSWYRDKTSCGHVLFDPSAHTLAIDVYSMNGFKKFSSLYTFPENYAYYSCKTVQRFKDLMLETVTSGKLNEGYSTDSFPQRYVKNVFSVYEATNDYLLHYKEKPFTGQFEMSFDQSAQSFKFGENNIKLALGGKKFKEQIRKDTENYYKNKRVKNKVLLDMNDLSGQYEANFIALFPQLNDLIFARGGQTNAGESSQPAPVQKLKGRFENGKPVGVWMSYDATGKVRSSLSFENGEVNGEVKYYAYAYPENLSRNKVQLALYDAPTSLTHYLAKVRNFRKGILNGAEKHFDWKGNVIYEANYKDGYLDGITVERNKIFTSQISYEDGLYDGIMQTKLSLPGKDTILLYDLNFQNHQLQGESRAYHANGKLAKKGFFLNNEPIEDYEAYDSLGVKYHYVKFLYTFPVEEKIWEENELSVKYEYNWQDSIYFRPTDLIDIPSVYDLLYSYHLIDESYYNEPYYGRSSIIDKAGISYQVSKFYPNQILAREGTINKGKKTGCWRYYDYEGKKLYEIDYFDTILVVNDSIKFKSKGIYYDFNTPDSSLASSSYVIEKIENYDCSHTDHYENRQFYTIWMAADSKQDRMNGYVKNYFDNGTLQSEGNMSNGLPTGVWKYYTPNGMLNQVGTYVMGKRHGRWLSGDLSKTNYLGDICMNPNAPDIEERIRYQENILDIQIRYFKLGKIQKTEVFDLNLNK